MTATAPLRGVHVAVAGDDSEALKFLREALTYHGALVTTHDSEASVMRLMQILRVSVLVVDVSQVDDGSLALIRKVRALPAEEGGRVPVVALFTGSSDAELRIVAQDVDSTIRKPVPAAELARVLVSVLAASPST